MMTPSQEGLSPTKEGYVDVEDVLALNRFRGYAFRDVEAVVRNNDKQRFALRKSPETGKWQIRANQGHTIKVHMYILYRGTPQVVYMLWNKVQCNNYTQFL